MGNFNLTKEDELAGLKSLIPDTNPESLEECAIILSEVKYKAYGFSMVMIYFDSVRKKWNIGLRNTVNLPNIECSHDTMKGSIHLFFDGIRKLN